MKQLNQNTVKISKSEKLNKFEKKDSTIESRFVWPSIMDDGRKYETFVRIKRHGHYFLVLCRKGYLPDDTKSMLKQMIIECYRIQHLYFIDLNISHYESVTGTFPVAYYDICQKEEVEIVKSFIV